MPACGSLNSLMIWSCWIRSEERRVGRECGARGAGCVDITSNAAASEVGTRLPPQSAVVMPRSQAPDGFFFQAEDGIRDFHVTGVQTCALPIYEPRLLQSLKSLMEAHQYQVDTALGGKNACLRLLKQSYDLVLLD